MDGIQPYPGPPRTPSLHPQVHPYPVVGAPPAAAVKAPSDYLRALRRRVWAVLAIGVPLSMLGGVVVARLPNVYQAKAQILITPPQFDPVLATLVAKDTGHHEAEK